MLRTILIDDDSRDREVLELLLSKYCTGDVRIAGSAASVDEAYKLILESKPDLVFLDVELGDKTAFDLLSKFQDFPFKVIFVTAYERYAIQAIKFNALDYLLKPVEITELVKAVEKISSNERPSIENELRNLIQTLAHPHHKTNRIAVPVLNGFKMLAVEDILYCEARKEYTYIYCRNQAAVCSSINLGEYEDMLQDYGFCRVHHSYLVNKDHVQEYIKGEGGEILLDAHQRLPVSRRKKEDVIEWLKK